MFPNLHQVASLKSLLRIVVALLGGYREAREFLPWCPLFACILTRLHVGMSKEPQAGM